MEYTKGEWKVKDWHTSIEVKCGNKVIADLDRSNCSLVEDEANANLIAQAPRMYEALKALTFQFAAAVEHPYSADTRVYTQANEALAKAEGR